MKLYELAEQYLELANIEDMDPQALTDTLEGISGEIEKKAEAIVAVRANMDSSISAIDAEVKRLTERKRLIQSREKSMREYLRHNMSTAGIKKIECPLFSITLAAGRDVVEIDDLDSVPDEYVDVETSIKPDKKRILAALKKGESIDGATLKKSAESVRIK